MANRDAVKDVFAGASRLPPGQRGAYLDAACRGDAELRREVEGLLKDHDEAGEFLGAPTAKVPAEGAETAALPSTGGGASAALREGPGSRIGPYKLLQLIGEGGFGSVFLAEQEKPVVRKVALKIIKLGMDTRQVVARFEQERQALAMMDHPNIAKVLDAGATDTGRPYFVMELVRGDPITAYCDTNNLSTHERLELFSNVCHAVQHAHQKGIIHRDIKPGNVLVTVADGKPIPKVIDFGIAKATAARLTEKTLFTEHRALIGTPEYMSPEQAEMSGVDIDTRSDIYSLGVLLYELLTGTTPFDSKQLRSAAYGEIQRIIREVDPPKPSTRLSTLGDSLPGVAAHRRIEPAKLSRVMRGDLDWIVMKAMEKDRTRRYETANGLAADVLRHLAGEAVLAAPPSTGYRARKFVRRNRGPVLAAGVVACALVLGLAGTIWQARRASEQRDLAQAEALRAEAEAKRADAAAKAEKDRADELKQVADFQAGMLQQINATDAGVKLFKDIVGKFEAALTKSKVPEAERAARAAALQKELGNVNATDTAVELIDRTILKPAIGAIDAKFKEQPLLDARLRQTLMEVYYGLGRYEDAVPLQESALATRRRLLGESHAETLESINAAGALLMRRGKIVEAEKVYRDALETMRRSLGEEHVGTLTAIDNLATMLRSQGKFAEAEPLQREILEKRRRVLGEDHPHTLISLNNMGLLFRLQGKFAEAEPYYREALERRRRVLGEEHSDTLVSLANLGALLQVQGKNAEAEPYLRDALEKRRRVLGEDHPDTIVSISQLGPLLQSQGKFDEAEACYRETLEKRRRVLGEEHQHTLAAIGNLGGVLAAQGKLAEAEPYYRETLEKRLRLLGKNHPDTITAIANMGFLLHAQRKFEEAEALCREAVEARRRVQGAEHPDTLTAVSSLGAVLRDLGKYQEAIDLLVPVEAAVRKTSTGANAKRLAGYLMALGRARTGLGHDPERFALAEANLLEAHTIYSSARGVNKETRECGQGMVDLYTAWNAAEPGKGYDGKAAEWKSKLAEPPPKPGT